MRRAIQFLIVPMAAVAFNIVSCNEVEEKDGGGDAVEGQRATSRGADLRSYDFGPVAPSISRPPEEVSVLEVTVGASEDEERQDKIVAWILDCMIRNPKVLSAALRSGESEELLGSDEQLLAAREYHELYPGSSLSLFMNPELFDDAERSVLLQGVLTKMDYSRTISPEYRQRNLALISRMRGDKRLGGDDRLQRLFAAYEGGFMVGAAPGSIIMAAEQFEGEEYEAFVQTFVYGLRSNNGAEVMRSLVGDSPTREPEGFEGKVLDRWLTTVEPKVALDFLDPNAEFYRERRLDHYRKWLTKDSVGASDWMRRNMDLPDRDQLGNELVEFIERAGNPEDAGAWREALGISAGN